MTDPEVETFRRPPILPSGFASEVKERQVAGMELFTQEQLS